MIRFLVLITILAVAACSVPIKKGPRNLNDALLKEYEESVERQRVDEEEPEETHR